MITEIRLVSNDGASTAAFFGAIFNAPAVDLGGGRWRVTPVAGPTVTITTARVVEAITSADLTVTVDHGAPDRLRALDFEVALDGSAAVDVNGTDATVYLVARGWDGYSDVPWEEPSPDEIAATTSRPPDAVTGEVVVIETDSVSHVSRFLSAWFDMTPETVPSGVVRFPVRNTLIRVEPAQEPRRQWVPLGSRGYLAAVARCAAAGFTVTPSPTHPTTAGHCDIGQVTFLLTKLERPVRDDAYYAGLSASIEAGDYEIGGPLERGPKWEDPR